MPAQDASHFVRSFGQDVLAEFEDGNNLGVVHVTLVRSLTWTNEKTGTFENGPFWGLVEFEEVLDEGSIERLARGDVIRLRSDPMHRHRRVPGGTLPLLVEPVRNVRGDRPRWLVHEIE